MHVFLCELRVSFVSSVVKLNYKERKGFLTKENVRLLAFPV